MTKIEKSTNLNSDRPSIPVFNSYTLKICLLFVSEIKK